MKILFLFLIIYTVASCSFETDNPSSEKEEKIEPHINEEIIEFGNSTFEYNESCVSYLNKMFHYRDILSDDIKIFEILEFKPTVKIVNPWINLDSGVFLYYGIVNINSNDTNRFGTFKFHGTDCFVPFQCYSNALVFDTLDPLIYLPFDHKELKCGSQDYSISVSDSSFSGVWIKHDSLLKE